MGKDNCAVIGQYGGGGGNPVQSKGRDERGYERNNRSSSSS